MIRKTRGVPGFSRRKGRTRRCGLASCRAGRTPLSSTPSSSLLGAGGQLLIPLLCLLFPQVGSDAAAPTQVSRKIRTPLLSGKAAIALHVFLLLLQGRLRVPVAIGLRGSMWRKPQCSEQSSSRKCGTNPKHRHSPFLAPFRTRHKTGKHLAARYPRWHEPTLNTRRIFRGGFFLVFATTTTRAQARQACAVPTSRIRAASRLCCNRRATGS